MSSTGTIVVDRVAGGEAPAVAIVHLYGPRGGYIGSATVKAGDARVAAARLTQFSGGSTR
jgi:hypothetical protein